MSTVLNKSVARRHELLQGLAEHMAVHMGKKYQTPNEQAMEIGNYLADCLVDHWKGQTIYIPSDSSYKRSARDIEICERMERGNAHEIAAEFGLSYVRVYQINARYLAEKRQNKNTLTSSKAPAPHPKSRGLQAHNIFSARGGQG